MAFSIRVIPSVLHAITPALSAVPYQLTALNAVRLTKGLFPALDVPATQAFIM